jgi:hypothetical protein
VIFDECVFPFTELHSNVGAHLHCEINLLPSHLLPLSNIDPRGQNNTTDLLLQHGLTLVSNCANSRAFSGHVQDIGAGTGENLVDTATEDDSAQESAAKPGVSAGSASGSLSEPTQVQGSKSLSAQELSGRRSTRDLGLQSASVAEDIRSSQLQSLDTRHTHAGSSNEQGSELRSSASSGSAAEETNMLRPRTRLQDGIWKEKKFTDGTVCYGCAATARPGIRLGTLYCLTMSRM